MDTFIVIVNIAEGGRKWRGALEKAPDSAFSLQNDDEQDGARRGPCECSGYSVALLL